MRVAFISIGDPRDVRVWSGIPNFVLQEMQRQATVEIVAPLSRTFKYLYAPLKFLYDLRKSQLHFDRHPIALRSYARQVERAVNGKGFDAILAMSSVPISAIKTDVPVFFWMDAVLEGMVNYYPTTFSGLSKRELAIGHKQEQGAFDRALCAAYSSEWAAESVREYYNIRPGGLEVIEFGANLNIDHDREWVGALTERRLNAPVKLLFLGVDWQRKGGSIALEATRLLNERGIPAILQVAGCEPPESPYIEKLGFISKATPEGQQRLKTLLSEATFLLFPTRSEAAGIVFAESSAFGLPIVTTDTGGVPNYVRNGENGFCLPMDASPEQYADRVQQILADRDLYRQLSFGGFDLYKRVLNYATAVNKLLQVMQDRIAAQKRGA